MSSERFESLEFEFDACSSKIGSILDRWPSATKEDSRRLARLVEERLAEASCIVTGLEREVANAPSRYHTEMAQRARRAKEDFNSLTQLYHQLSMSSNGKLTARQQLLQQESSAGSGSRGVVIQSQLVLERTSQSLGRSHQIAAETESVGNEIIDELSVQRESLLRTQQRLRDTDEEISRSRKILNTMYIKVITNKIILIGIVLIEVVILGILVYWKFFTK